MKRVLLISGLLSVIALSGSGKTHYVGGDISLLPQYVQSGAKYYDHSGKAIAELLPWLHQQGMNAMRVRLFVDPDNYTGADRDPNACQSIEYIIPLCKQIKEAGFSLVLDFHYSDSWADPAKQWTPEAWKGLSDDELYSKINEYTSEVLVRLKSEGIVPEFIQPGNEISYGMLWGEEGTPDSQLKKVFFGSKANWARFGKLLERAIFACRKECPKAKIILHTERVGDDAVLLNFYAQMADMQIDYDIIGLSYYPYFHGDLTTLSISLSKLQSSFPSKEIMIVETGYSYKWEVPGTKYDYSGKWSYSDSGQDAFARDLVNTLEKYDSVTGLFWWWMEYNAYGTSLEGWYNAPLFDSTTGRATSALTTICSFAKDNSGISEIRDFENIKQWYNLSGLKITEPKSPGIYINNGKKVLVK